ncbi:MAG: hypothetical protein KDL87_10320, partial [Verrucomicrobiae bacterium]|nr:hypothetical protein [Verrucomicrobiae bacterium]
ATPPSVLFLPIGPDESSPNLQASLMEAAIEGKTGLLFRPQVIGYRSIEDLRLILMGQIPEALTSAIEDFRAIQGLTERMDHGAICRNEAVQGRLRGILEKSANHLSAKAMLDFGARPADAGLTVSGSVKAIESALQPVIGHYTAKVDGIGFEASKTEEITEAARRALSDLRSKVAPETKSALAAAENAVDAAKIFLSLANPDSSIGQQRQRELQERIDAWKSERIKIPAQ